MKSENRVQGENATKEIQKGVTQGLLGEPGNSMVMKMEITV